MTSIAEIPSAPMLKFNASSDVSLTTCILGPVGQNQTTFLTDHHKGGSNPTEVFS